jgi:hypothetical protein
MAAEDSRIIYWAACGTLLAWARTGAVIEYDDDVDVGVPSAVLDMMVNDSKVHELLVLHNMSMCFNTKRYNPVKLFSVHSFLPFVDLIRHTPSADGNFWQSEWYFESFWTEELFPLQRCTLGGVEIWCPRSPWTHLERVYGGMISWLFLGRHWMVPSHYAEHNARRTLPYEPKVLKESDALYCPGGVINMQMPYRT